MQKDFSVDSTALSRTALDWFANAAAALGAAPPSNLHTIAFLLPHSAFTLESDLRGIRRMRASLAFSVMCRAVWVAPVRVAGAAMVCCATSPLAIADGRTASDITYAYGIEPYVTEIWAPVQAVANWLAAHYAYAPALVLGLLVFVLFPSIAICVGLINRVTTPEQDNPGSGSVTTRIPPPARATRAVLELHDPRGVRSSMRFPLTHPVVQIGRSQDVDILVNDPTVHRLHAAIHRTDDAEYCVTDLCAGTGNGVAVNGQPVFQQTIRHGDEIQIGRARLTFFAN